METNYNPHIWNLLHDLIFTVNPLQMSIWVFWTREETWLSFHYCSLKAERIVHLFQKMQYFIFGAQRSTSLCFSPSGPSTLLWLPGVDLWHIKASQPQVWGHGSLCEVLPDPASGGQPGGGRPSESPGRRPRVESGARGPGVAASGSLRLHDARLDRLPGKEAFHWWFGWKKAAIPI